MMSSRFLTRWILLCCVFATCSAQETCYPPGGVAGIVVATIVVTVVVGGLATAVGWRLWSKKHGIRACGQERRGPEVAPTSKGLSTEFAFDNPYFRDQENDQDTEKGKMRSSINNKNSLRSSKVSDFSNKTKKSRSGKNPFTFSGGASKKQRALDDSCLQVEPERAVVSLRGHDFTGLGFNICGNMRDGILVKDVLHRGPASESGLIKAGDKIISVTVSFTNIVYEDALTILSYASPYDVQLELERVPDKTRVLPNTPSGTKRPLGSCSFNRSGQKLFHPLYRSQSIDDLTQIDRDSSLPPTLGLGPRRSQSVGVAAHKLAAHFKNSDSKLTDDKTERGVSSNQMVLSTTGSLNEKMLANVMADGSPHWKKRFEDTLDGDTTEVIEKSTEQRKDSTPDVEKKSSDGSTSQTYMKKNMKFLDSPLNKGKLQTYKSPVDKDRDVNNQKAEHSRRAKTMAEASSALWQLDQSIQDGEGSDIESSKSSNWNPDDGIGPKSSRFPHKEDENESDVSHDSLEFSNKKTSGKKSKKHASASHSHDRAVENETLEDMKQSKFEGSSSAHKQNYQQKSSKKNSYHAENNKSKGHSTDMSTKNEYSRNAERVYANNILNKSGGQNCTDYPGRPKEDSKTVTDAKEVKGSDGVPSVVYANHREMQEKVVVGRGAQKTVSTDHSNNYGKVNGRAGYSERQKLSGTENCSPNYGSSRIVINGETDEMKNRFASSKNNYPNQSRDSPSNYPKPDGIKSDEVMRWMENKHKSNMNQKFSKSSASPAGMFTQINPFQQPARHKNANFKIWTGREELSANGNESQYTSSLSNSYGSESPVQTSRRENMPDPQPYVSKTVLISPYETNSRNGMQNSSQILSYRQQH